jgi:DivIVA domain-containing protein
VARPIPAPRRTGCAPTAGLPPLTPGRVRERQFRRARHGLDPADVHDFLHRVADELAAARAEVAWTRAENLRIKEALRGWQARFGPPRPAAAAPAPVGIFRVRPDHRAGVPA